MKYYFKIFIVVALIFPINSYAARVKVVGSGGILNLLESFVKAQLGVQDGILGVKDGLDAQKKVLDDSLLNAIEQLAQQALMVAQQLEMIEYHAKSVKNLANGKFDFGKIKPIYNNLNSIIDESNQLAHAMGQYDRAFRDKFPGYQTLTNYQEKYKNWADDTLNYIQYAYKASDLNYRDFRNEKDLTKTLYAMSENPEGQTQALQAGNMITINMLEQLQKMRQLQLAQMDAQNSYMASQVSKQAAAEAAADQFFKRIPAKKDGRIYSINDM